MIPSKGCSRRLPTGSAMLPACPCSLTRPRHLVLPPLPLPARPWPVSLQRPKGCLALLHLWRWHWHTRRALLRDGCGARNGIWHRWARGRGIPSAPCKGPGYLQLLEPSASSWHLISCIHSILSPISLGPQLRKGFPFVSLLKIEAYISVVLI